MKKLSTYLFLILFSFSTPSFADDVSDFEIEGMSVGDSLLDYLEKWNITEEVIINSPKNYYPGSKKFYGIKFLIKSGDYDNFGFLLKENDKKYIIYILRGKKVFANDLENCKAYKEKIVDEFEVLLKNLKRSDYIHKYQRDNGKSISYITSFKFEDGSAIRVYCDNWSTVTEKEIGWQDSLNIEISSVEGLRWINLEAYK